MSTLRNSYPQITHPPSSCSEDGDINLFSEPFNFNQYLLASDITENDSFGSIMSLSADGTLAAIGTLDAEQVYIFERIGNQWAEVQVLTGSDTQAGDQFGRNVFMSSNGKYVIVGAALHNGGEGGAYVFFEDGGVWTQQQKLTNPSAPLPNDYYGGEVYADATGTRAVVGVNNNSAIERKAHVFVRTGTSWALEQTLTPSDSQLGNIYSDSAIMNRAGDLVVVGADGIDANTGAVYIYTRSGSTWTEVQKLPGPIAGNLFGRIAAISDDDQILAIVDQSSPDPGNVHVFKNVNGAFSLMQTLSPPAEFTGTFFARGLAMSGDGRTICAGGQNDDAAGTNVGVVNVYNLIGATWTLTQTIYPPDPQASENFWMLGMDVSGEELLIGSRFYDAGTNNEGRVYYYSKKFI